MFKDLSLEYRNIQTQNYAPIQCTLWPSNVNIIEYFGAKGAFIKVYDPSAKNGDLKILQMVRGAFGSAQGRIPARKKERPPQPSPIAPPLPKKKSAGDSRGKLYDF